MSQAPLLPSAMFDPSDVRYHHAMYGDRMVTLTRWIRRFSFLIALAGAGVSRDGNLAVAGDDGIIRVFDVSSRKKIGELKVGKGVVAVNFSEDGRELVAGEAKYVHMFNTQNWKPLPRVDSSSDVRQFAFRPDGQLAVAGSKDVVVYAKKDDVWIQTEVDVLPSGSSGDATALSADGRYWASCGHMASQNKNCAISNVSNGIEFTRLSQNAWTIQPVSAADDSGHIQLR